MIGKILIIIFILSLVFISTAIIYNNNTDSINYTYRSSCFNDDDCVNVGCNGTNDKCEGAKCVYDPDYMKNVCIPPDMKICKISDTNVEPGKNYSTNWEKLGLTKCTENADCNKCINQPQWGCYKDWPVNVDQSLTRISAVNGKCVGSDAKPENGFCYIYPPGDENGKIENAGYCMPIVEDDNGEGGCNPTTSDIYLTQHDKYSSNWSCMCKNPAMFDHKNTVTSDCTFQKTCGYNPDPSLSKGTLYMKPDTNATICKSENDCESDQKCCISNPQMQGSVCLGTTEQLGDDESLDYVCHNKWDETNTDNWVDHGKCLCEPGYTYVNIIPTDDKDLYSSEKLCLVDSCYDETLDGDFKGATLPYLQTELKACKCPSERPVQCPEDIVNSKTQFATFKNSTCQTIPECLSDPCGPHGTFDNATGNCVCDDSFVSYDMQWSVSGNTCEDPCKNNGPCGDRGVCNVQQYEGGKTAGCECNCPHTNPCQQYTTEDSCNNGTHVGSKSNNPCNWNKETNKCSLSSGELKINGGLRNQCQETIPNKLALGDRCPTDMTGGYSCCGVGNSDDPYTGKCVMVEPARGGSLTYPICVPLDF